MPPSNHPEVRFLLRPAAPEDLPALEQFAASSAHGITTLPADRAALAERIRRSADAFATDDDPSGEEIYLFVLEDRHLNRLIGTSGIAASAGFADRFYSFRNEFVVHASKALDASNRIHTLHLCHDLTGVTLLTSFYIEPGYRDTYAPHLLSRGRLLFIAQFAERFSERIAAENPGVADDIGNCPFWDAVGRRFFDMDYPSVERLSAGRSKAFIAELMPTAPVYVPLLPEQAQWSIGQLHPDAELPFSILLAEGFDPDTYVDIFDGGPTVHARTGMLRTVAESELIHLQRLSPSPRDLLVATSERCDFRVVAAPANLPASSPELRDALRAVPSAMVRVSPVLDLSEALQS